MTLPSSRDGMRATSAYDRTPTIDLPRGERVRSGEAVWTRLRDAIAPHGARPLISIDAYPGADLTALTSQLRVGMPEFEIVNVEQAAHTSERLDELFRENLTDDRVFGVMSHATIDRFYDSDALDALRTEVQQRTAGIILIGWGAANVADADVRVLGELARWEIQLRYRRGMPNWHADNADEDPLRKIKRGFFVEWRAADRHKRPLFASADFVMDLSRADNLALISGDAFRGALTSAASRPFRVVPYFDPGVWGGQWMKEVCGLDESAPNYAWSFDGVPEENSLLLTDGDATFQIPAIDLVFAHPRELLGERTFARFGAEFPIRFDLLDTMGAGTSLCRCIRSPTTSAIGSGCRIRRTRATTCSMPTMTRWSISG